MPRASAVRTTSTAGHEVRRPTTTTGARAAKVGSSESSSSGPSKMSASQRKSNSVSTTAGSPCVGVTAPSTTSYPKLSADTLMVFGLDHLLGGQEAAPEEIAAITEWLKREGTCLLLAPHHDVGFTDDYGQRQMEYEHHGDRLVPRQQRFSQYTRSLMRALDVPVHNIWGLRPAVVEGTKEIAPLTAIRDLDSPRLLDNVTTFNFHPHLPHYELTAPESDGLRVLGRQRVDPNRPHPFTAAGNTEFNALIWMPPAAQRAGDIVLIDSTHFTTLFGGTDSLRNLWHNLATMK
jgi:hypothetical protein